MKIILTSLLMSSIAFATSPETVAVKEGQVFTVPCNGAFISQKRASEIRQICEQHRIEASLCEVKLQEKDNKVIKPVLIASGISVVVGLILGLFIPIGK